MAIHTKGNNMQTELTNTIQSYWDARPCNLRHSELPVGTKEYFDAVEAKRYKVEPHNWVFADFDKWAGKKVLEIGCGIGTDAVNFARAGAHYTGIELSEVSLMLAQKRFNTFGLEGEFLQGTAESVSELVAGNKYDLIYSYGVIHHAEHPQTIVNQLHKLLKHNGRIKIMLYATHSWKNMLIQEQLAQPEAQAHCPVAHTYTREQLTRMFDQFDITVEQDFVFPYQIEPYKRGEYVLEEHFAHMDAHTYSSMCKHLGWNMLINGVQKTHRGWDDSARL